MTVQRRKSPDEEFEDDDDIVDREATRTAHDVTETVMQLRMDSEEKQRQLMMLQQRLVDEMFGEQKTKIFYVTFRINNVN